MSRVLIGQIKPPMGGATLREYQPGRGYHLFQGVNVRGRKRKDHTPGFISTGEVVPDGEGAEDIFIAFVLSLVPRASGASGAERTRSGEAFERE